MFNAALALATGMLALAQAQESISTKELAPPPGMSAAPAAPAVPATPPAAELREIGSPPDTAAPAVPRPAPPVPVVVEEAAPAGEKKTVPEPRKAQHEPQSAPRKPEADKPSPKEVEKAPAPQKAGGGRVVAAFWVVLPPR